MKSIFSFESVLLMAFVFVALVFSLMFYSPVAYSQDSPVATPTVVAPQPPAPPSELPVTAGDTLPFIEEWLLFVAGLIATHIMAGFKKIPGLGNQEWLAKLVTELVSGLSASLIAFLLGTAAVGLGFLDESGLWQVILFAWPAAVGIYHGKKFSKAKVLKATAQ